MKDKEYLLSFECPLRFIWSHSALKEGWDNPNVFQVCTLLDQKSVFTCRQKIGRGLRLCVNQNGERIESRSINLLHVIANESFSEFAGTLQKEIEDETGMKFGTIEISLFNGLVYEEKKLIEKPVTTEQAQDLISSLEKRGYIDSNGKITPSLKEAAEEKTLEVPPELEPVKEQISEIITKSEDILEPSAVTNLSYTQTVAHFEKKGYINSAGKIKDTMKNALKNGTLDLPKKYEAARSRFESLIQKADTKPPVRDASRDVVVRLKKQVVVSPEFQELWNKIKHKTLFRVKIDADELIQKCVKEFEDVPEIPGMRLVTKTADIDIEKTGVISAANEIQSYDIQDASVSIPNVAAAISEQTLIPRRVVLEIIKKSGRGREMIRNPQMFIEKLSEIITNNCCQLDIDGISYQRLAGEDYYVQEIFDADELMANLDKNAVQVDKSLYDYVVYDSSTVEKPFAVALDSDPDVRLFFKIPDRFKIQTPIGTYNPDWAVYLTRNGEEKLFFVLETKGSTNLLDLRTREQLKIHCGKKHFEALHDGVEMQVASKWDDFRSNI